MCPFCINAALNLLPGDDFFFLFAVFLYHGSGKSTL